MNSENNFFKKSKINYDKLIKYGFKEIDGNYTYERNFLNNQFKFILTIDKDEKILTKVIDLDSNEEFLNIRSEMNGEFINIVRKSYEDILTDIKKHCFENNSFIFNQSNRINTYIKDKYKISPEFLWSKFPGYGVFRNKNNNKWFVIIMNIDFSKIDNKKGEVEIINIKCNNEKIASLLKQNGIYKAYHMNKNDWISIVLDDTLTDKNLFLLIDESYNIINN